MCYAQTLFYLWFSFEFPNGSKVWGLGQDKFGSFEIHWGLPRGEVGEAGAVLGPPPGVFLHALDRDLNQKWSVRILNQCHRQWLDPLCHNATP